MFLLNMNRRIYSVVMALAKPYAGFSAMALAVVPYSLLSRDTLFSIPQFIIVCLLAQVHPSSGKNAVQDAAAR